METHSRAYYGIVWLLRGAAIWLFLRVLFGLAASSLAESSLKNGEAPEFSFDRLATRGTLMSIAMTLVFSALIWYASEKIGRLLARAMRWEGPEETGAAPDLQAVLSEADQQRWMVGLRRRRLFMIAGFALFWGLVAGAVKDPIIFSRLVEGTPATDQRPAGNAVSGSSSIELWASLDADDAERAD